MLDYLYTSVAVANAEIRKLMRDPTELFSRAVQPALWLAVFGQVRGIPTGRRASLRKAFCSARSLRDRHHLERDLGIVHNLLVTPAPRSALAQAIVVYLVTVALRVHICWEPGAMVVGGSSHYALGTSFGVMLVVFALLAFWAARLYPGLTR